MSHPKVKSNPVEAPSPALWEHKSKRERSREISKGPGCSCRKARHVEGTGPSQVSRVLLCLQSRFGGGRGGEVAGTSRRSTNKTVLTNKNRTGEVKMSAAKPHNLSSVSRPTQWKETVSSSCPPTSTPKP